MTDEEEEKFFFLNFGKKHDRNRQDVYTKRSERAREILRYYLIII